MNWSFGSYGELLQSLEGDLNSRPRPISRKRDLTFLRDRLFPAAQQWGVPLAHVNQTGLSKARLLIPRARKALEQSDGESVRHLCGLAARLSWRELRRELGALHRHRLDAQVHELPDDRVQVIFTAYRPVWVKIRRLTKDHVQWEEEVREWNK